MLHHCFTQPTKWTKKQMDWLTCGPVGRSLSKASDLHPTADILLQSLVFFPQRCRNRLLQPSASSGVVLRSSAKRYPADGQAIPPLRTSCYSLPSVGPPRTRTSQVSHSSPSATPLPRLPHLRVVPVWGLAVVHRLGALGAAWSTYESHRKRTVRGEPDGWDPRGPWSHARKVPPYYALYVGRASVFREKNVPPTDRSDPLAISLHARKCLLITHKK